MRYKVCVDGWSLNCQLAEGLHTRSTIATAFAIGLESQSCNLEEVAAAFHEGVARGTYNLGYYSGRRTPKSYRRRTA